MEYNTLTAMAPIIRGSIIRDCSDCLYNNGLRPEPHLMVDYIEYEVFMHVLSEFTNQLMSEVF